MCRRKRRQESRNAKRHLTSYYALRTAASENQQNEIKKQSIFVYLKKNEIHFKTHLDTPHKHETIYRQLRLLLV